MKKQEKRILGRLVARELTVEELRRVAGGAGTTSCSNCQADDCDQIEYTY